MRLQEIKERLAAAKENNVTNIVQKEHDDLEWIVNRMDQYIRVNIELSEANVDLENRLERYEKALNECKEHRLIGNWIRDIVEEALNK